VILSPALLLSVLIGDNNLTVKSSAEAGTCHQQSSRGQVHTSSHFLLLHYRIAFHSMLTTACIFLLARSTTRAHPLVGPGAS